MRLLIVSPDYKPDLGGLAENAYQVTRALAMRGAQIRLLACHPNAAPEDELLAPLGVRTVRDLRGCEVWEHAGPLSRMLKRIRVLAGNRRVLKREVADFQPDFILASSYSFYVLHAIPSLGVPFGIEFCGEDMVGDWQRGAWSPFRRFFDRFLRSCRTVMGVSNYVADLANKASGRTDAVGMGCGVDLASLPKGMDPAAAKERLGLTGKQVIFTLARLDSRKGQDTMIQAMPRVLAACPDAVYVFAGKGPEARRLEELARTLGVRESVRYAGVLSREDVGVHYSAADLFVMASRFNEGGAVEGFGIVFLEAGAYRKPVVGTRVGGIPHAVADGVSGLLVEPDSPAELADAVVKILRDPSLSQRMAEAGFRRATEEVTWKRIGLRVHEELRRAIASSRSDGQAVG